VQRTCDDLAPVFLIIAAAPAALYLVVSHREAYLRRTSAVPLPQPG